MKDLSPERWQRIDALFEAALEQPTARRDAFVNDACRGDPELEREVRELLESAAAAAEALGDSVSEHVVPLLPELREQLERADLAALPADGCVGPYRILREIGRGGMGTVYLAERADAQFRKRVALKLVKRGMDTDEVLQRFRYERQILASLEHPNIARLYDGGAAEDGRPYLVMEYIEGSPITAYCDREGLSVRRRLRLFETVCGAVRFAHRNLVVHRDIKPSNVLVTADGVVKLLDFGIAKLLDPAVSGAVPQTRPEMRLLTPEYAAPEQLQGAPVTTASDVYALGVVLFELLTGRRPGERSVRGQRAGDRPSPLERPSSAVRRPLPVASGDSAPASPRQIAERRATTPERLFRTLRGDLDTITLKALAEEPERRYESAEHLLADVQRYLKGLPVLARGESFAYRAGKFVRRHHITVSLSATLVLLLTGFTATTLLQAREIKHARAVAEARQARAEDLIGFVLGDLRSKLEPIGRLDVLNDVGTEALAYFAGMPEAELSDEELFRRSEALRLLGQVQLDQGNQEAAARTFAESLALGEALAGRDSLAGAWQLGLGTSHFWVGNLHFLRKDPQRALPHLRRYLRITERLVRQAPDSTRYRLELSYAHGSVGSALEALGDREGALREYRLALEQKRRLARAAPDDPEFQTALATAYNKVAVAQRRQGALRSALENHRAELAVLQAIVARSPDDAQAMHSLAQAHSFLGDLLMAMGEDSEGARHGATAWRLHQSLVARDPSNAEWRRWLAISARLAGAAMLRTGESGDALVPLHASRDVLLQLLATDPERADYRNLLGRTETHIAGAHRLMGRPEQATRLARQALETIAPVRASRPDAPEPLRTEGEAYLELGRSYAALGQDARARDAWERALAAVRPAAGAAGTSDQLGALCIALLHLDRREEARPIAETLLRREYRAADFVALLRESGLAPQPPP